MSKWKKTVLSATLISTLTLVALSWYKLHYSMDIVDPFAVTVKNPQHRLLIATQGSDYKNAVVDRLIDKLKTRSIDIQVIDVSALANVEVNDWSAIVILHTWESWQPQVDAKLFTRRQAIHDKIIIITTSGNGTSKMDGIDAITSASELSDAEQHVVEIVGRLDVIFAQYIDHSHEETPFTCEITPQAHNDVPSISDQPCEKQVWGAANNVVNFKHLYISEQPDAATFDTARDNKVSVVINLRSPSEFDWDEALAAKNAGLTYYNVSISGTGDSFDPLAIEKISKLVEQHKDDKILLHCSSGNRAGAWLAIHMVEDHHTDIETAITLAKKTGITKPKIEARVRQYLIEY
jgi:protein tyrosine phosphatase (PTP) superfamily phosphohydrolase (DUF442 family)